MPSATSDRPAPFLVLGVAGGVAAYKSVDLARRLVDAGYHVAPVLTPDATRFVGALTFSALGSEPARVSLFADPSTPIPHTALGRRCDLVVVAPATAHLIARYARGLADDLLSATLLATRAPVLICPAMHTEMWEHPSVQENVATLRRRGVLFLGPAEGRLAGGDVGAGRMAEPEEIAAVVGALLAGRVGELSGRRVLVTAGGTREPIDPVRVITNRSSGRQGTALATVAARWGADVTLVTASELDPAMDVASKVEVVRVDTAAELAAATLERSSDADVVIMAAAVSDFTVVAATTKLKRDQGLPHLELAATTDVVAELVARRQPGQVIVAFAAETTDVARHGAEKLARKGVDLLVVNDVSAPGVGFAHETNEVSILEPDVTAVTVSRRSKEAVATVILARVASIWARGEG
ncbi:MAG: bifunctional phosphopantothenoylcysteine decarboxylase/phosphopantothenate--cysteine ligase CoaBC [Acidimicrobiales bacterium]